MFTHTRPQKKRNIKKGDPLHLRTITNYVWYTSQTWVCHDKGIKKKKTLYEVKRHQRERLLSTQDLPITGVVLYLSSKRNPVSNLDRLAQSTRATADRHTPAGWLRGGNPVSPGVIATLLKCGKALPLRPTTTPRFQVQKEKEIEKGLAQTPGAVRRLPV